MARSSSVAHTKHSWIWVGSTPAWRASRTPLSSKRASNRSSASKSKVQSPRSKVSGKSQNFLLPDRGGVPYKSPEGLSGACAKCSKLEHAVLGGCPKFEGLLLFRDMSIL